MFDLIEDTIVAVASAPGSAPVGIVRCSGPQALTLTRTLCSCELPKLLRGFHRHTCEIGIEPGLSVPATVYVFKSPHSYTGQNSVEFYVPGSPALLTMLIERLVSLGARVAQPGEFTARAFLACRMDLTEAESVEATIRARSDAQLRAARRLSDGSLGDVLQAHTEQLAELVALVEAEIDFVEEPIDFISAESLRTHLVALRKRLQGFMQSADSIERTDVLPRIVLVGRSNAGKSTLMNRLSGMDRSICSPMSGTTRDLLSAPIQLGTGEAILFDTAGVDPQMEDLLADAGAMTLAAAAKADLVCYVVDLSADWQSIHRSAQDFHTTPTVVVGSKCDLLDAESKRLVHLRLQDSKHVPAVLVSGKTGEGINELKQRLAQAIHLSEASVDSNAVLLTARHRTCLQNAIEAIKRAETEASQSRDITDRSDILAFELREALNALGAINGAVTTEDLLGRIFSSFCIGK